jgi:hypothetical protein
LPADPYYLTFPTTSASILVCAEQVFCRFLNIQCGAAAFHM